MKKQTVALHATKALGRRGGIAPTHSRPLYQMGMSALAPGKGPLVPMLQEAGCAPEPVWTHRLEERPFHLCWGSNLDHPVIHPIVRHYTD
jgi:hypothetical protein